MRTSTFLVILGLCLSFGCGKEVPLEERVVVEIADDAVTVGEFEHFVESSVQQDEPFLAGDVMEALFEQFIEERLLLKAAEDAGIRAEPDAVATRLDSIARVEAASSAETAEIETVVTNQIRIEMLVEDAVFGRLSVSDEEVGAHFAANQAFFERPETVKVSQILMDDEGLANTIATELGGRTTRFEELAKEHSVGPEASRGGNLGSFARGELPPSLETTIFSLRPGRISAVVATDFGFHIFLVHEKVAAAQLSLDEARDSIRLELMRKKSDRALALYIEELKNTYPVTVHREHLSFAFLEWEESKTAGAPLEESP